MKAEHHGSPPLARWNQHSNSSINHLTTKSRSNPYNQRMPPFLRLDSTGEVATHDRSQKNVDHIKTNTCYQGTETSEGSSSGRNGFFGKLFSQLVPQPSTSSSTSSSLLDSSKTQDRMNLDELLLNKPGFRGVPMAEKPSHMKMAQINVPHLNKYGQWRILSHVCPSYPVLPRGVFPCHVLQAQREPHSVRPTSGHFVKNGISPLECCSFLDAWKCSPDSSNSQDSSNSSQKTESQKTESDSDSSISLENIVRSCDKVSSTQNWTTPCLSKKNDPLTQNCIDTMASISTTSFTDERSNHGDTAFCMKHLTASRSTGNCQSQTSGESSDLVDEKENFHPQRSRDQSSTTKTPSTKEKEEDQVKAISSQTDMVQPSVSLEVDWDDDDDWESCQDNIVADGEEENEEQWDCFVASQFCLSSFMSRPSRKQPLSCEEEEFRRGERRVSKPCPALTAKWLKIYSDTASSKRSPFKVRFECGEGKDTVHEFVKGDDETLTVMELQKARDQIKQHEQNAAKLLQQKGADSDDDDDDDVRTSDEGGSGAGAVGGAKAVPKKKCSRACAGNTSRVPVPTRKDNSSQNTDSEEEDEQDNDSGKIDDDDDSVVFENDDDNDSVVFENDDDGDDGVVFENEQSGVDDDEEAEESDGDEEDEESSSSEEEEDEDSDIDIVFECDSDDKKKKKEHSHG